MDFFKGIQYNIRGLKLGLKTPGLLTLGFLRFFILVVIAVACVIGVFSYQQDLMNAVWTRPDSAWILWLWYLVSWLISLVLIGVSTFVSYVVSQIFFSVLIMDIMSQITERMVTGQVLQASDTGWFTQLIYLVKQEIPRTLLPVGIALIVMVVGWLTPLGPFVAVVSSAVTAVFLAWDNTDLVPARRLKPFGERLKLLTGRFGFHLGFGILFLVPIANILFLSFAPVGATLYYCEEQTAA